MTQFEIHVSASYITEGQEKAWNCFKEYVEAKSAAEAKKSLRAELKAEGYKNISMEAIECEA